VAVDSPHRQTSRDSRGLLLYDRVREQLDHLISRFALQAHETLLGQAFELLSREALAIPAGAGGPGYFSTLNEDGTPFQLAMLPLSYSSWVKWGDSTSRTRSARILHWRQ